MKNKPKMPELMDTGFHSKKDIHLARDGESAVEDIFRCLRRSRETDEHLEIQIQKLLARPA